MKILIADDNFDARLLLQKTLQSAGHQITLAVHGKDALEKALLEPPELIISDILMPEMDGFNFCAACKDDSELCRIPFVFYTAAYVEPQDEKLAQRLGASHYIIKPQEPAEFLQLLDKVIAEVENGELPVPTEPLATAETLSEMCSASQTRQLEEKVRELEIYQGIYRQVRNPTCVLSPQGVILHCNPAHAALLGSAEDQLQGSSAADYLGEQCLAEILKNAAVHKPYQAEVITRTASGNQLSLDISTTVIRDGAGETAAIIVLFRDLTRARESERKLQLFRNMIEQSNDAVFIVDAETSRFHDVNQMACTRWGYSREELLTLQVSDINPRYRNMNDWQRMLELLREKLALLIETTHQTKTGEIFPVEISLRYVKSEAGDYIIAVARDISERRKAEAQQHKSQQQWDQTFDAITDIITIQDLDHRITQCNRAACVEFGLKKEQIIGQTCFHLFEGSDAPCGDCPIPGDRAEFTPHTEEKYHPKLDKTYSVSVYPLVNDDEVTSIVHFAEDISERKKLENQLRQAQKMESLGTLAGGIAHDFNNILSAVIGYAHLAQAKLPKDSKIHADLQQVLIGGKRAAELVKQILTFSRKGEQEKKHVLLQDILQEALKLLRASIPTSIEIRHDFDPECPPILADATQMNQIVMNLCTNAMHAMQKVKTRILELSLSQREISEEDAQSMIDMHAGRYLLLTVSDTGEGMDEETLAKILDPYFTTKTQGEGTGLGLAMVHGIVKNHGGQIVFYSEPGAGTSCKIYLPVTGERPQHHPEESVPIKLPGGTERLLIVDDEVAIGALMETVLENYGYQVTRANRAAEALHELRQNSQAFDLILTDLSMPQMDGIELAGEIRNLRADIPIILCSGFLDSNRMSAAAAAGINICLMKPLSSDDLLRTVRRVLDSR